MCDADILDSGAQRSQVSDRRRVEQVGEQGQEPDEDDEQREARLTAGVLRPDDCGVYAHQGLDHGQRRQHRCQDCQVFLRVQFQQPVQNFSLHSIITNVLKPDIIAL